MNESLCGKLAIMFRLYLKLVHCYWNMFRLPILAIICASSIINETMDWLVSTFKVFVVYFSFIFFVSIR